MVSLENTGFYITKNSTLQSAKFLQYDGFEENIKLQEKIDNYTIIEIGDYAFYIGEAISGVKVKSVQLPDTIEKIGNFSFYGLSLIESITIPKNVNYIGKGTFSKSPKLKELKISPGNQYFSLDQGVLYDYNKTKLINFIFTNGSEYTSSFTSLIEIDDYSFYYAKNINKLILPGTVKRIGEGAFESSSLKEIYFSGPQPIISNKAFSGITVTIYYPKTAKWDTDSVNTKQATKVNFAQWDPPKHLLVEDQSNTLIWVIIIIAALVVVGLAGFILYKRKCKNNDSIEKIEKNITNEPII